MLRRETTTVPNANTGGSHRRTSQTTATSRSTGTGAPGTRFRSSSSHGSRTTARASQAAQRPSGRPAAQAARPAAANRARTRQETKRSGSPIPIIVGIVAVLAIVAPLAFVVAPRIGGLFGGGETVEAGQEVELTIPEGATGDDIASILAQNHIIDNPKEYYAAVDELDAAMAIKPGDYLLYTGQDAKEVVQQLVDGPNITGVTLTIQEGLTVAQTAARVEETLGISADEFLAQAKASNYAADYPFLEGAYDDSLEGYLYPKTYNPGKEPTADSLIRQMLDQFETETASLDFDAAPNGLSAQEVVTLASLVERETAVADERPLVASVIYNRLDEGMRLQIDAAIVYARGGGSDRVTYDDLEIDSPYNVYKHDGLTPGPICSPSVSSIEAALEPAQTDYLYYVASPEGDGSHNFSSDYEQFEKDREAYLESQQ